MRLEEKDMDFKRVSVKYGLLLTEKERMDRKLNGRYFEFGKILRKSFDSLRKQVLTNSNVFIFTKIQVLQRPNGNLNTVFYGIEPNPKQSKTKTMNEQLKSIQFKKNKTEEDLNGW